MKNPKKGILIPLCQGSDTCTLREAAIICACLREHSIPPLHAAAGLLKIAEMDYNGVNSLFLRVLLEKKYALVSYEKFEFFLKFLYRGIRLTQTILIFLKQKALTCFYCIFSFYRLPTSTIQIKFTAIVLQDTRKLTCSRKKSKILNERSIYRSKICIHMVRLI